MPEYAKPTRYWREIACEASRETDPEKLKQLCDEFARAFEERARKLKRQRSEDDPNTRERCA